MPFEEIKALESNQYRKSDQAPFIIYEYLECLIENTDGCKNNPENSSTTKLCKHIPSGFSMSTILSFKKDMHDVYREKKLHEKLLWPLKRACNGDN